VCASAVQCCVSPSWLLGHCTRARRVIRRSSTCRQAAYGQRGPEPRVDACAMDCWRSWRRPRACRRRGGARRVADASAFWRCSARLRSTAVGRVLSHRAGRGARWRSFSSVRRRKHGAARSVLAWRRPHRLVLVNYRRRFGQQRCVPRCRDGASPCRCAACAEHRLERALLCRQDLRGHGVTACADEADLSAEARACTMLRALCADAGALL
jgi:hypothetical protein